MPLIIILLYLVLLCMLLKWERRTQLIDNAIIFSSRSFDLSKTAAGLLPLQFLWRCDEDMLWIASFILCTLEKVIFVVDPVETNSCINGAYLSLISIVIYGSDSYFICCLTSEVILVKICTQTQAVKYKVWLKGLHSEHLSVSVFRLFV